MLSLDGVQYYIVNVKQKYCVLMIFDSLSFKVASLKYVKEGTFMKLLLIDFASLAKLQNEVRKVK